MNINELHKLAASGDKRAEAELFTQLAARFALFARQRVRSRPDAEEAVQEALRTVFEKYREVEVESSFSGWAYQVLNYKLMTMVKTQQRRRIKMESHIAEQPNPSPPAGSAELEAQLLDCLRALHRLNPKHARILNLHQLGYSVEEICERLDLTPGNLYSSLSRARARLQSCLDQGKLP